MSIYKQNSNLMVFTFDRYLCPVFEKAVFKLLTAIWLKTTLLTIRWLMVVFVGFVLIACSTQNNKSDETKRDSSENKIAAQKEFDELVNRSSQRNTQVPDAVSQALRSPHIHSSAGSDDLMERFDVSVNALPAKDFFLSLFADSGANIVAHPEISGVISLDLKNVTVKDVLNVVRDIYGYEYKQLNGIYTILPRKLRTEIFPINYLDVQRVGVTDTSVLIGEITSDNNNNTNRNNRNNNNRNTSGVTQSTNLLSFLPQEKSETNQGISPGTRVQTLSKTDFWYGINRAILEIIGGEKGGRFVMTNPQSGLVVVKAMPRELNAVKDFLTRSELNVKRQVVLETKILEVTLNDGYESGINWGAISGEIALSQSSSGQNTLDQVVFGDKGVTESLASAVLNVVDITKLLFLLEKQGSVQVLSSPRVSTVNNQKAVIRVGSDEFFVTGISNATVSNASSIVNTPEIDFDSFFSGISLDVTPQISDDGDVILHVHPLVSNVQDQIKEVEVSGESFSVPLALRDVRESDAIVKAKSGQVVVLGGLMQETSSDVKGKRPLLGSIPLVKHLFKTKQTSLSKTELVILMRPIVVDDGSWDSLLDEDASRFENISNLYRSR